MTHFLTIFHIVHVVLIFFDSDLVLWLNIFLNLRQIEPSKEFNFLHLTNT